MRLPGMFEDLINIFSEYWILVILIGLVIIFVGIASCAKM